MATDDSLFPLSPRDERKLGDDSMECTAADLLLGTGEDSLFNDSLEDIHISKHVLRAAMTEDMAPDENKEQDLDDHSLNFDETQLPFEMSATTLSCVQPAAVDSASGLGEVKSTAKIAGFQVAENITASMMHDEDQSVGTEVAAAGDSVTPTSDTLTKVNKATNPVSKRCQKVSKTLDGNASVDLSTEDSHKGSSPSSSADSSITASAFSKTSKVVPSFGRKKGKTNMSPTSNSSEQNTGPRELSVKNSNETNGRRNECCTKKKGNDQCVPEGVPEDMAKVNKPQKSKVSSGSNKNHAYKFATSSNGDQITPEVANEAEGKKPAEQKPQKELQSQSEISKRKEEKSLAQEQKKREREEKKKEVAKKKLEREQKRREAEEKRAEKERLKKERQLELEMKKAEREAKKIEQALKKTERAAHRKGNTKRSKKKECRELGGSDAHVEPIPGSLTVVEDEDIYALQADNEGDEPETEIDTAANTNSVGTAVCGVTPPEENAALPENTDVETAAIPKTLIPAGNSEECHVGVPSGVLSPHRVEEPGLQLQHADEESHDVHLATENSEKQNLERANGPVDKKADDAMDTQDKENTNQQATEKTTQKNKVEGGRLKMVFGQKRGGNVTTVSAPKSVVTGIQAKKTQASTKPKPTGVASTGQKSLKKSAAMKQKKRRRHEDNASETKCSKPANYTGPVWVQCERPACQKWRRLGDCTDPLSLPDSWNCTMNIDPERASCSAEEEHWSEEVGDSQEFVETPFIPGSLVWAKMEGYPWWPAMVEEDPNKETYYEMGKTSTSSVPVKYHVVFFDTPVSRGWVSNFRIHPYTENHDHNTSTGSSVSQKLRRGLTEARKQANRALAMTVTTRLIECSFAKRFRRMTNRKRRTEQKDEVESFRRRVKLPKHSPSSRGRKSSRLEVKTLVRRDRKGERGGEGGGGSERADGRMGVGDGEGDGEGDKSGEDIDGDDAEGGHEELDKENAKRNVEDCARDE